MARYPAGECVRGAIELANCPSRIVDEILAQLSSLAEPMT
jgi:hypothetical protein